MIAFGGPLLLAGRLGDLIGRRSIFLAGLAVFTVASLLCGLAQTQEMLVAARFVQGVGGAMTSAVILIQGYDALQTGLAFLRVTIAMGTLSVRYTEPLVTRFGALGLAVLATLSASRSDGLAEQGESTAAALTGGYQLAFWIGAALVGAAIVVAAVVLQREPKPQAEPELRPAYSEA